MRLIPRFIRRALHEFRLRHRFPGSVVHAGATANGASRLGDSSVLFANVRLVDSSLGNYSYVQENSTLYGADVGPFCSIAANVTVGLLDHPMFMVSTSPVFYDNTQPLPRFFVDRNMFSHEFTRTVIEADVWIGEGARIRAGVRIGVGAVIGAGALVTRNVTPYSVVAGSPARVLRMRFEPSVIRELLRTRWWEHSEQVLIELAQYFDNPHKFILAAEKLRASSS